MLAIIPARGGSKALPRKNIRLLNGKPLIAYTIEVALKSKSIDRIVVSTDDNEIAEISKKYGAEVPFMRPKELATDNSLAIDTYLYTIERLNKEFDYGIEDCIVLLPTTPFKTFLDIDKAVEIFKTKKANSVISVVKSNIPIAWHYKIESNGTLINYLNKTSLLNRQDEEETYIPNGSIYVFKYEILRSARKYYTKNAYPYIMSAERSIDIDAELDFKFAEFLIKRNFKI